MMIKGIADRLARTAPTLIGKVANRWRERASQRDQVSESETFEHPAWRSRRIPISQVRGLGVTHQQLPVNRKPAPPTPQLVSITVQTIQHPALAANG